VSLLVSQSAHTFRYASPRLCNQLPDSCRQPHQSCHDSFPHAFCRVVIDILNTLSIRYSQTFSLQAYNVLLPAIRWYGRELRLLFLCPVTDISATVAPIGVKFCTMVHIGPGQILSLFGGDAPGIRTSEILGLNFVHLTANISKTVSRSVT